MSEMGDDAPKEGSAVKVGETICTVCRKVVVIEAIPDAWEKDDSGEWRAVGYWPGTGVCCGQLYAEADDDSDFAQVYDLKRGGSGKGGG